MAMATWVQFVLDFCQTLGVLYACSRCYHYDKQRRRTHRTEVPPVSVERCTGCNEPLQVVPGGVLECPICNRWWSECFPPSRLRRVQ